MKRAVAGGVMALVAAAGLATVADGQSSGPPESGTFTYDLVSRFDDAPSPTSNPGVNPARPRDPDRQNPADIQARTGRIYVDGRLTGRSHAVLTWTYLGRGRQQRGAGLVIKVVEDFGGNDTLVYEGLETNDPRENPLAVVGGTGKYAGADGTATVEELRFDERTLTAYERITVKFTP